MSGHISLRSLKSTVADETDVLAKERWNVVKEKQKQDDELAEFHRVQLERCKIIRERSNARAVDIYEKLLYKLRWAHPSLPLRHRNIMVEYCEHLLGPNSHSSFSNERVLQMCYDLAVGTPLEKISEELKALCLKIETIANKRDASIIERKANLMAVTEKAIVKNEGKLRWMMETNVGRKDRYWTIWFLASRGMKPELKRFLESPNRHDVDERDPDFGLTALHFACKQRNLEVVSMLIEHGANINAKTSDGRTPLHLAAQYSTIEIVGHLLMLGVFFDARDNYGLMPIDLAFQNKNKPCFDYLDHWNKLIPPAPPEEQTAAEDLSLIPEEYLATSQDVVSAMSLKLQLLTKRIDGEGTHSFHTTMDPLTEMRLCEKHSLLCIQEGFLWEGVKSLRRRWRVAKKMLNEYLMSATTAAANTANVTETGTGLGTTGEGLEQTDEDAGSVASGSSASFDANANSAVLRNQFYQSSSNVVLLDAEQSKQGTIPVRAVSFTSPSRRTSEALKSDEPKQLTLEAILAATMKSDFKPPAENDNAATTLDGEGTATAEQTSALRSAQPTHSKYSRVAITTNATSVNPQSVCTAGRDLAETLINNKFEGFALTVLCECLCLPYLDDYSLMCVHIRVCEVCLFLYDFISQRRARGSTYRETHRTTFLPPARKQKFVSKLSDSQIIASQPEMKFECSAQELIASRSLQKAILAYRPERSTIISGASESSFVVNNDYSVASSGPPDNVPVGQVEPGRQETTASAALDDVSQLDSVNLTTMKTDIDATMQRTIRTGDTMGLTATADQIKSQKLKDLLQLAHISAHKALELHQSVHTHQFREVSSTTATNAENENPIQTYTNKQDVITLCPLLTLASEVFERSFQWHESISLIENAEIISSRLLGHTHTETIKLMLLGVKLLLKCGNVESFRAACSRAVDMSRRLDTLTSRVGKCKCVFSGGVRQCACVAGQVDSLGRQCAELIALSKMLELSANDEEDDAAEEEDDKEDKDGTQKEDASTNSSSSSSSSTFAALQKKLLVSSSSSRLDKKGAQGSRSTSAIAFIHNIKQISATHAQERSHYANDIGDNMQKEIRAEKRKQKRILRTLEAREAKEQQQQSMSMSMNRSVNSNNTGTGGSQINAYSSPYSNNSLARPKSLSISSNTNNASPIPTRVSILDTTNQKPMTKEEILRSAEILLNRSSSSDNGAIGSSSNFGVTSESEAVAVAGMTDGPDNTAQKMSEFRLQQQQADSEEVIGAAAPEELTDIQRSVNNMLTDVFGSVDSTS